REWIYDPLNNGENVIYDPVNDDGENKIYDPENDYENGIYDPSENEIYVSTDISGDLHSVFYTDDDLQLGLLLVDCEDSSQLSTS
ncbi:3151_t:CDS:2, partial [Funneliformis geosporum]